MQQAAGGLSGDVVLNMPNLSCDNTECSSQFFTQLFVIKKISALASPTGKKSMINIPLYACAECGMVPKEFTGLLQGNNTELDTRE